MDGITLAPETVVERGDWWTIAVNRNQNLLAKTMLVLNRPCTEVVALEPQEWFALHDELRRLVPAIRALFAPDQFNFAFLMNQDAQTHLHVIPRYATPRKWHGRRFEDAHWGASFGSEDRHLAPDELGLLAGGIRDRLRATRPRGDRLHP